MGEKGYGTEFLFPFHVQHSSLCPNRALSLAGTVAPHHSGRVSRRSHLHILHEGLAARVRRFHRQTVLAVGGGNHPYRALRSVLFLRQTGCDPAPSRFQIARYPIVLRDESLNPRREGDSGLATCLGIKGQIVRCKTVRFLDISPWNGGMRCDKLRGYVPRDEGYDDVFRCCRQESAGDGRVAETWQVATL